MAYTWRTRWPGVLGQHADHCPARDGDHCDCGPVGYRASLENPESGEPVLSPVLDSPTEARTWRYEQHEAFEAWKAASEERPSVDGVVEEFLAAAARGSARDRFGRRFDADGLRGLRWALTGHVHEELGSMAIAEVRTRHVQSLVDRLDAAGLSQRRVDGVVHALRAVFAYAIERDLATASPADAVALPDDDEQFASTDPPGAVAMPLNVTSAPPPPGGASGPVVSAAPIANAAPLMAGVISEQVIWTCLKAVTLMFILIALILVAESV